MQPMSAAEALYVNARAGDGSQSAVLYTFGVSGATTACNYSSKPAVLIAFVWAK